jgi:hypothetical protein
MDTIKQYLPWIIGGVVLLFILSRLKTNIVPQTTLTQTPQADPYAQNRFDAFQSLIGLAGIQTQADAAKENAAAQTALAVRGQDLSYQLESSRITAGLQALNLQFLQRDQDRQLQQRAIDASSSARTQQTILGSINTALQGIFGNKGGGIFGTPKTFPTQNFF